MIIQDLLSDEEVFSIAEDLDAPENLRLEAISVYIDRIERGGYTEPLSKPRAFALIAVHKCIRLVRSITDTEERNRVWNRLTLVSVRVLGQSNSIEKVEEMFTP